MKQGYFTFLLLLIGFSFLQERVRERVSRSRANRETDGLLLLYVNASFLQLSFFLITGIVSGDLGGMLKEAAIFLFINALAVTGTFLVCRYCTESEEDRDVPDLLSTVFGFAGLGNSEDNAREILRVFDEEGSEVLCILPCGEKDLYLLKGKALEDHGSMFLKADRKREILLLYEGDRTVAAIRFDSGTAEEGE